MSDAKRISSDATSDPRQEKCLYKRTQEILGASRTRKDYLRNAQFKTGTSSPPVVGAAVYVVVELAL